MRAIEQWLTCVANKACPRRRLDHWRHRFTVPDGIIELSTETAPPTYSGLGIFAAAFFFVSISAWAQVAPPQPLPPEATITDNKASTPLEFNGTPTIDSNHATKSALGKLKSPELPVPKHYSSGGCTPDKSAKTIIASCSELIATNAVNQENLFQVFFLRGTAYAKTGKIDQAIEDFDQSLRLRPGFPGALYHRGNAFFKLGAIRRAIEDYDQAISGSENFLEAVHHRGIAYETIGEKAKAIDDFRSVLKTAPWDKAAQDELKKLGE
jgi:tetratricopeptide (TPR) repeat protein